jgi:hypothetical protein
MKKGVLITVAAILVVSIALLVIWGFSEPAAPTLALVGYRQESPSGPWYARFSMTNNTSRTWEFLEIQPKDGARHPVVSCKNSHGIASEPYALEPPGGKLSVAEIGPGQILGFEIRMVPNHPAGFISMSMYRKARLDNPIGRRMRTIKWGLLRILHVQQKPNPSVDIMSGPMVAAPTNSIQPSATIE